MKTGCSTGAGLPATIAVLVTGLIAGGVAIIASLRCVTPATVTLSASSVVATGSKRTE